MTLKTEWVAVDWGTSNVRAWGIATDGTHTFTAQSDRGMGKIARADYPSVLAELIADRAPPGTDTVVCGMAGARQGWMRENATGDRPMAAAISCIAVRSSRSAVIISMARSIGSIIPSVSPRTIDCSPREVFADLRCRARPR